MNNDKYELIDSMNTGTRTLYRIRAKRDFADIVSGTIGGWIESENNLSTFGDAWVSDNARVFDNARVSGNARVFGNARVSGNAWVSGNAEIARRNHIFCAFPVGSRNNTVTFFRCKSKTIYVNTGCFFGNIWAFREKVKQTHNDNIHGITYLALADVAERVILGEGK